LRADSCTTGVLRVQMRWKRTSQNFVRAEKEKARSNESFHAGDEGIV